MSELPTGTLTFLFTDIEGSTHLLQQLGERYAGVLSKCRDLLRAAFHENRGHEVDTQGDSFFVAFARATDAVAAAADAQRALATHSWPEGVALRVRIGLHTGEPSLVAEGYVGLDVHYTARIMSAAHGGQVLLSQMTRDLVQYDLPDGVHLRDLGEHRLKDLQRPSRLYQLIIEDLPADFSPLNTLDSRPNNLPVQFTPLIGREQEAAAVQHLLQREHVRLVTLTGPGGIGKTRLGLQVAAELSHLFSEGVYFVNLASLSDPEFIVLAIAETLGIREVAGQSLLEHVQEDLHQKQLLLVLDNFEQVVSAAPQLVGLLSACPRPKLLVTSREVLHVRAEHEFAVPPLALPDLTHLPELTVLSHYAAVMLFIERAQAVKSDFQVTRANARAVAEMCVHLDGLPLALELAAARVKLFPPQALLTRLEQRLAVLTSGARDAPVRQQSLRNTIAWSYELLLAEEQRLFRRLSVFVGSCTLQAIEAVCAALDASNGAGRVSDGAASLIDKSLLQQTEQDGNEPRLVMLETIREYGLEVLEVSGEMEITRQAHAEYYLQLAEEVEPELRSAQSVLMLERLEREHDNLRAVMQWLLEQERDGQKKEMALRLGTALQEFWYICGSYSEGQTFLEQALAGNEGVASSMRAKALDASGEMVSHLGDQDRTQVLHEESLALSQSLGDTAGIARSLQGLGWVARDRGDYTAARQLSAEALALWREVGNKERIASTLRLLGVLHDLQGEPERARTLYEESLVLRRELKNKSGIADSLRMLAQGHFYAQGDPLVVGSQLEEALALYRETGSKSGIAICLGLSAQVALSQGDRATARRFAEESMTLYRETGDPLGLAFSLSLLGEVEASQGNFEAARSLYEESLAIAGKTGDKGGIAFYQEEFARVIAAQGELTWAVCLWGSAEVLNESIGASRSPFERISYERAVTATRAQLGETAFAAAWAAGRVMTPEQALAMQGKVMMPTAIPARPVADTPKKSPIAAAGVTERELEVLRLLATGLTDAQIAEQLVLSLHTIHAHLRTIYSKLGVTSRSAATRYAFEHQLV